MKKLLLLVLVAACHSSPYHAPPAVASIAMPAGAQLKPYDATKPGVARPEGLAQLGAKAYVTLANTDASTYAPSGPGFVASIVPSTGVMTAIDLGGPDEKACQNAGAIRAYGNNLYVTCGGAFDGTGTAVVELDATGAVTRTLKLTNGVVPYVVAATASKIWVGDALSATLIAIDRASFQLTTDHVALNCQQGSGKYPYTTVADLQLVNGDLYALCGADVGGTSTIARLDATTGAQKATSNVGPLPTAISDMGDGRIAVVNSGDNTLMFVTPAATSLTAKVALTFSSQTSTLQQVVERDGFLYTVASGSNTVQKIDPNAAGGAKVIGEVNVGNKANPWNILPLDDFQALVTNWVSGNVVSVKW